MQVSTESGRGDCEAGCPGCGPEGLQLPADAITGGRLAILSAVFFLNPLAVAIIGAVVLPLAWRHEAAMFVGGLAGLLFGMIESVFVSRLIHGAWRKRSE